LAWIIQNTWRTRELHDYEPNTNLTEEAHWESQGKRGREELEMNSVL
jgi:hypothetical protein